MSASGATASAARHQFSAIMRIAASDAKMMAVTVNPLEPLETGAPEASRSEMGVIWMPSTESPEAASASAVAAAGAPGRRIFSVFFCVTVVESIVAGAAGASVGMTESGMREVCRMLVAGALIGAVTEDDLTEEGGMIAAVADLKLEGMIGDVDDAPGVAKSVGRFRRMVFGAALSDDAIGIDVVSPIAESREMRDVFDLAA